MTTYTNPDIVVDDATIIQQCRDVVQSRIAGWIPRSSDFVDAILEAGGRQAADALSLLVQALADVFVDFGQSIVNLPKNPAVSATANATYTLSAPAPTGGITFPAGQASIGAYAADGTLVQFDNTVNVVFAAAATTATVVVAAAAAGSAANGLSAPGGTAVLIDSMPQVASVTMDTAGGGVDAETTPNYMNRLAEYLTAFGPKLTLARDGAVLARLFGAPDVYRAMGLDGYKSSDHSTGNEDWYTVVVQGSDGGAVSSGVLTSVQAQLAALREANFTIEVINPVITSITVAATVVKTTAANSTQVHDDVLAALGALLNPATWGGPRAIGDDPWSPRPKVYYNDVVAAVQNVAGVDHITSLTVNGGTADVTLSSSHPEGIPTLNVASSVTVT